MNIKVIGAGFGRTGTDSMREALNQLGLGPCHHMRELIGDPDHKAIWRAFQAGGPADWSKLLGGYGSCVDWPSANHWRELTEVFPDAKVVLTWRSAESWWRSYEQTILQVLLRDAGDRTPGFDWLTQGVFGGRFQDQAHCMAVYEANVNAALAEVPAGRLLVHRLGDGWPSLCAHLGVPVPETPYPRINSTAEFQAHIMPAAGSAAAS